MPAYIPVYPSLNERRGALCKLSSSSKELSRVRAREMPRRIPLMKKSRNRMSERSTGVTDRQNCLRSSEVRLE
ncbi:unnamed protein product [Nezara viridula]|uniref:Uncharacterized protein n=1 Tax=Nezara viridula TaxID=85310 RepID=A0A9P0HB22_NEZVI|nr:unnamed protein product [Nezara viridula]CAH1398688.1 unnamed protein product [Nezara viridula]